MLNRNAGMIIDSDTDNSLAYAKEAMDQNNWLEAIKHWQKIFLKHRANTPPEAYLQLSMAHRRQGNIQKAYIISKEGTEKFPNNVDIIAEKIQCDKELGNSSEIVKDLKKINELVTYAKNAHQKKKGREGIDNKLRIRTPEERIQHAKGLKQLKRILDVNNVPFYLSFGTLLGAYREKDFIPWDWDVTLAVKYEDIVGHEDELLDGFRKKGFILEELIPTKERLKIVVYKYGISYELLAWHLKNQWRVRLHYKLPSKFFLNMSTIEFYNESFFCLGPIEDVLTYIYGNWQKPIRTAEKAEYLSSKCFQWGFKSE